MNAMRAAVGDGGGLKIYLEGALMATIGSRCFAAIIVFAVAAATGRADEPQGGAKAKNKLVGTWKLVSAKYGGREFKLPEGNTMLKHVTATQFMWAWYDRDGNVTQAAGGGYTVKGELYEQTPTYGIGADFDLIKGKAQTFKGKVEGNRWRHDGKLSNGLTIEQVWELDEKQ